MRGVAGGLFFVVVGLTIPKGINAIYTDLTMRFSTAKAMASYIKMHKIPDPIGAFRSPETSSLLPYLPDRKFWYLGSQREGSYVIWDKAYFTNGKLKPDKVVSRVKNIACESDCPPVWVLLSKPLKNPELHGYQLEFTTAEAKDSPAWKHRNFERYYLYRPLQPASL